MPYPGGVTNQWDQPTYRPQAGPNQVQPPFMGQNYPNYQQFGGFYDQPQHNFSPIGVALPYQYYNYTNPTEKKSIFGYIGIT